MAIKLCGKKRFSILRKILTQEFKQCGLVLVCMDMQVGQNLHIVKLYCLGAIWQREMGTGTLERGSSRRH